MAKKLKLKGMVEYILANESPTRDCDIALTIAIWKKFYPDKLKPTQDGGKYPFSGSPVKTSDLKPMYALLQI